MNINFLLESFIRIECNNSDTNAQPSTSFKQSGTETETEIDNVKTSTDYYDAEIQGDMWV